MKLFLPTDLPLERHLNENPPFKGFSKDKLVYLIHLIVSIPQYRKDIDVIDGFVPLSSKALQEAITDYKRYLTFGIDSGLLASDNTYMNGEKCIGYKLLYKTTGGLKEYTVSDFILRKHYGNHIIKQKKSIRGYEFLERWFSNGLTIDREAALAFLKEELELKTMHPDLRDSKPIYNPFALASDGTKGTYELHYKDPFLQFQQGNLSLLKMQEQQFSCTISENGRFHSVLTNMRSGLRNFLTFNGERLVSIDVKNSQPYLISLLLQSHFWRGKNWFKNSEKSTFFVSESKKKPRFSSIINLEDSSSIHNFNSIVIDSLAISKEVSYFMLLEISNTLVNTSFDTYIENVLKGGFYETLQEAFKEQLGYTIKDRKEVKSAVFQLLFTPNRFYGQKQAEPKRLFAQIYPEVYATLKAIKKEDATLLPRLLQQIESHVILKVVAKRMQKLHPKVPIFTIHDSIVTTALNQLLVEQVMRDAFTTTVGFSPTLATEFLDPDKATRYLQKLRAKAEQLSA